MILIAWQVGVVHTGTHTTSVGVGVAWWPVPGLLHVPDTHNGEQRSEDFLLEDLSSFLSKTVSRQFWSIWACSAIH